MQPSPLFNSGTFPAFLRKLGPSCQQSVPLCPSLQPLTVTNPLKSCVYLPVLDTVYKWNHEIRSLSCPAFSWHNPRFICIAPLLHSFLWRDRISLYGHTTFVSPSTDRVVSALGSLQTMDILMHVFRSFDRVNKRAVAGSCANSVLKRSKNCRAVSGPTGHVRGFRFSAPSPALAVVCVLITISPSEPLEQKHHRLGGLGSGQLFLAVPGAAKSQAKPAAESACGERVLLGLRAAVFLTCAHVEGRERGGLRAPCPVLSSWGFATARMPLMGWTFVRHSYHIPGPSDGGGGGLGQGPELMFRAGLTRKQHKASEGRDTPPACHLE